MAYERLIERAIEALKAAFQCGTIEVHMLLDQAQLDGHSRASETDPPIPGEITRRPLRMRATFSAFARGVTLTSTGRLVRAAAANPLPERLLKSGGGAVPVAADL